MSSYGGEPSDPTFSGTGSASSFVRQIRREALDRAKHDDDAWIAQLAASYLDGPALDWYENEIDEETQESWKLLRRAILQKWPAAAAGVEKSGGGGGGALSEATTPAPAAPVAAPSPSTAASPSPSWTIAPTPAAAAAASPSTSIAQPHQPFSIQNGKFTGRIRVYRSSGLALGWLSQRPDGNGDLHATSNVQDAVVVQFTPGTLPHGITILSGPYSGLLLGVVWRGSDQPSESFNNNKQRIGNLTAIRSVNGGWKAKTDAHDGPVGTLNWHILIDGTMALCWWLSPRTYRHLSFDSVIYPPSVAGGTMVVSHATQSDSSRVWAEGSGWGGCSWEGSRLVFEQM